MIRSMTGFGKGEVQFNGAAFAVEISTVNRKQLEIRLNLPRELAMLEPAIRQQLAARLSRGSVTVRLTITAQAGSELTQARINWPLADALVAAAQTMQRRYSLPALPTAAELLALPGVVDNAPPDADNPALLDAVRQATAKALDRLLHMREQEGRSLYEDLRNRLNLLKTLLAEITPYTREIPQLQKQRLLDKLTAENLPVDLNDERLLKEVLFYADKADVTEELTRLNSHFQQFESFLAAAEPTGRSLDFLLQEMFREITTLGNKAGGSAITSQIVRFKAELEKIREQVQNVE